MQRHRFFDLTLDSDIALPLPLSDHPPTVSIRRMAPMNDDLPEGYWDVAVERDMVEFTWEEAGRFIMNSGRDIRVHPRAGCSAEILVDSLLGECLGTILIQRSRFCLHASAVEFNGSGVVFAGAGGQGKSTLAWMSTKVGAHLVTEEITVIKDDRSPSLTPGPPLVKVRDSVVEMIEAPDTYAKAFPWSEKRLIHLPALENPTPLKHVLFLRPGDQLKLQPMTAKQVAFALMENTFAAHLSDAYQTRFLSADAEGDLFKRCTVLASRIASHALEIPSHLPKPSELETILKKLTE